MNLLDTFTAELTARINPTTAFTLAKQVYTRTELAEQLSGTTDHKNKAYKAARRNLERYDATPGKEQRKPSHKTLEKLVLLLTGDDRAIDASLAPQETHQVVFIGEVTSSQDSRTRHIEFYIDQVALAKVLKALKLGHDAVLQQAFEPYGFVPDSIANESVRLL